jgi:hypothetical protein
MIGRIALLTAAGAALLIAVGSATGSQSLTAPGTVRITDKLVKHIHVAVDKHVTVHGTAKKDSPAGDLDFYRQALFTKGPKPVNIGHSDLSCVDTGTGSSSCTGTYFLPKGKIMVGGVIASRLIYELAVVGGTGLYDNVRGTLTVTSLGGVPAREFLLFRLEV